MEARSAGRVESGAMKFSIRDVLLVTVIVAVCVAWWIDRSRLAARVDSLESNLLGLKGKFRAGFGESDWGGSGFGGSNLPQPMPDNP